MILVVLQNAWSPLYAGSVWPRDSWLRALSDSHSGRRLTLAFGQDCYTNPDYHFDNTTCEVSQWSSGRMPPDELHLQKLLASLQPDAVVACGYQATSVMAYLWKKRLLAIPHPAYRLLTNALLERANEILQENTFHRLQLVQLKGSITEVPITKHHAKHYIIGKRIRNQTLSTERLRYLYNKKKAAQARASVRSADRSAAAGDRAEPL